MPITRSFTKPFELQDYTPEINLVPPTYGLINQLGVFNQESVSQHSIIVESHQGTLALIPDAPRSGGRNSVNKDETRVTRSFAIPSFPLDDRLSPEDIQGRRAYGSADTAETEAAAMARKIKRLMRNHDVTLEFARAQMLTTGTIYAPNGTVSGNVFSEFGVTQTVVPFALGTSTTEVLQKVEAVIAQVQDSLQSGEPYSDIVGLASPEFFSAFISHPKIITAYQFYVQTQKPLGQERLGGQSAQYRQFSYGGVSLYEYRGSYNGSRIVPVNECHFFPMGQSDFASTYVSPASKMGLVNTLGELRYMFTYPDPHDEGVLIQTESNFLNLVKRPASLVKATVA